MNTTPDTDYVRDFYAKFQANLKMQSDYEDEAYDLAEAEFDRWLAEHDAERFLAGVQAAKDAATEPYEYGLGWEAAVKAIDALVVDETKEN